MNASQIMTHLRALNGSELFYREYARAKADSQHFGTFLAGLDMDQVLREHLLIPEKKETIPPEYLEEWYFDPTKRQSVHVSKHNCYTPPLMHHHNFFELFYVLEGTCYHTVGPSNTTLRAGDCCLIQPGIQHAINVPDESIVIDILIRKSTFREHFFEVLRGENILSSFFLSNLYSRNALDYIIFHAHGDEGLRSLVLEIYVEFYNKETYYTELVNALLTSFFAKLLRSYEKACELPPYNAADALKALEYIRHIQDNYVGITLESFAKAYHYTPEHTSRLIKSATGYTFSQLLGQVRLERAVELLRDTNMPIGEVAYQVGYMNPEHFIRKFKGVKGVTPKEYRHMARRGS